MMLGPTGPSIIARLVRIAGCAAFCVEGLALLHYDATAGLDTVGTGGFSAAEEFSGLAVLAAAFATPFIVRARWPRADRAKTWGITGGAALLALVLIPLQTSSIAFLALTLAATSRRSPVRPITLVVGLIGGLASFLALYQLLNLGGFLMLILMTAIVPTVCVMIAGAASAWLLTGTDGAADLRAARVGQGMYAGLAAGAVFGVAFTLVSQGDYFSSPLVICLLVGLQAGRTGAAFMASHLHRHPRPDRSASVGLFVSD
jgi:hypothetical protein